MSDEKTADVLRKLDVLKTRFREKASGDINLVSLMAQDAVAGRGSSDELRRAYQVLHRLAGSAGTFGFRALGDEARALELILKPYLEAESLGPGLDAGVLDDLLRERFIDRVRGLENLLNVEEYGPGTTEVSEGRSSDTSGQPIVMIVDPDQTAAEHLSRALTPHGFSIHCATPKELVSEDLSRISVVLIRDNVLIAQEQIPWASGERPPFICIGSSDTFDDRYRLAALGVDGFISEPVDVPVLADYMERLANEKVESGSGRVMIIDDDPELLERYTLILERGGMEVRGVSSPPRSWALSQSSGRIFF